MRGYFKISVLSFLVMFVSVQMSMSVMASTFQAANADAQQMQHMSNENSSHAGMAKHGGCHQSENHCADNASDNCASGACVLILSSTDYNFQNFGPEQRSVLPTSLQGVVIPLEIRPPRDFV